MDMTLEEALFDVEMAFRQIEFSIKLLYYCEHEKINPADFDTNHIVRLEQENLRFPPEYFKRLDDIIIAASVAVSLAFGGSALTLDKAWEIAGICPDPQSADESVKLRTLVHMVRCAYAHGVADPKWEVKGKYHQVLEVDLLDPPLTLDLRKLHGKEFGFKVLGGHARWFDIRNVSVATIKCLTAMEIGMH